VAYGTRAYGRGRSPGSLPWFAGALALDDDDAGRQRTHRLRLASVLREAPALGQMWFRSPTLNYAEYGSKRREVLASDAHDRWNVWDLAQGKPLHPPFGEGRIGEIAHLSPRGDLAVTTTYNAPPQWWDVATGQRRGPVQTSAVSVARFSADGARLATGGRRGAVTVWDSSTGASLLSLKHGSNYVMDVAFSPDGHWLAAGSADGTAALWNLDHPSNAPVTLAGHGKDDWIYSVAFSPDGHTLATASKDWDVRLWSTATVSGARTPVASFRHRLQCPVQSGWSLPRDCGLGLRRPHLGRGFASTPIQPPAQQQGDARRLQRGRPPDPDGGLRRHASVLESPAGAALAPDERGRGFRGRWFLRSLWRGWAGVLCHEQSGQPGALRLAQRSTENFQISHDGRSGVALDPVEAGQCQARRWTRDNQRSPRVLFEAGLTHVALTRDASQMAAWAGVRVVVLDLVTGRSQAEFSVPAKRIAGIAFNPAGSLLAVAAGTNLFLFDAASGSVVAPPLTNSMPVSHVEFSPDGRRILAACSDATLAPGHAQLWDARTQRPVGAPMNHRDGVLHATFSPDGRSIVTCGRITPPSCGTPRPAANELRRCATGATFFGRLSRPMDDGS
jgi:hypothetical protein